MYRGIIRRIPAPKKPYLLTSNIYIQLFILLNLIKIIVTEIFLHICSTRSERIRLIASNPRRWISSHISSLAVYCNGHFRYLRSLEQLRKLVVFFDHICLLCIHLLYSPANFRCYKNKCKYHEMLCGFVCL